MACWPEIVGQALAGHCRPLRLSWPRRRPSPGEAGEPATLELRVESAFALEVQQQVPLILARVNAFLGWQAAGRVVLRQGPVAPNAAGAAAGHARAAQPGAPHHIASRPVAPPPPLQPSEKVRAAVAGVQDEACAPRWRASVRLRPHGATDKPRRMPSTACPLRPGDGCWMMAFATG